ncbi:MAG: hypothetical protein WCL60_00565 [Methylococcales bacterium]|jgi:hypothetical protein
MNILMVGDKGKAACDECKSFVNTTYKLRNVPFSDNSGIVKNVLVGVCDCCGSVVALPHQSTPAVKRQLEKQKASLESRVPAHLIDILNLSCDKLGANTDFSPTIIRYYIHALSNKELPHNDMAKYLESNLAKGKSEKRLSIKGKNIIYDVENLKKLTNIFSTSDLIKSIILKINNDILIHENANAKPIKFLKSLIAISG